MSHLDNSSHSFTTASSPNRMRLSEQPNIRILLDEVPKRTNYLSTFKIQELAKPLSLHEEEQIANDLVQSILEQEKQKEEAYKLPEHLDQIRRLLDPPSKVKKKLPIISQLSPRTKAKLAALPRPNDYELQQIRNIEKMTKAVGTHGIYQEIGSRNRLLPVVSPNALQPAISKASSRPGTTSNNTRINSKPGTPLAPAAVDNSDKRELPPSQRLNLLLDDDKIEKSLPDIVTLLDSKEEKNGEVPVKLAPLSRIVPRENVPIPIKENNAMLVFKQVELAAKKEEKRREILRNLLGEVAEIDERPVAEDIGLPRDGKQKSQGRKGSISGALYQPLSEREMLHSRSASSYKKSRLSNLGGFSLLSHTMNPTYQPMIPTNRLRLERTTSNLEEQQYLHQFSAKVYDELGINLDAEYNRLRHYRQSLCVFFYYLYVIQVRAGLHRWKRVTQLLRHQLMIKAQFRIISFFRKVLYLRRIQRKNYYHLLQKQQEEQRHQQNVLFLRHNAWILYRALYRYWKMTKVKRALRNRRSTISIQKGVRGFIARRRVQKKIAFLNFLRTNATIIQSRYRRHLAKRRVHLVRKLKFIQEYMDFLEKKRLYHESHFHQVGALSRILQSYRLYQLKKRLFNMLFWLKFAKAIIIQRNIRGYLARKKHANFQAARARRQKLEHEKAIVIQCLFRRMHAENRYFALLEEKDQKRQIHYQEKLWKLAAGLSFPQRCRMMCIKLYRKLLPFRYLVLNKKATIIQRYYRGYHGRQRMKMVRVYARLREFYHQRRYYGKYSIKIQKHWRGYWTRKKLRYRLRLRMIIKIQCLARQFLAFRNYQRLQRSHLAARRITRFIRRNNIRRRFHRRYEREQLLGAVVIFLQNFFRVTLARRRRQRRYQQLVSLEEQTIKTQISLIHLLAKIQLKIIFETISKPIHKKYYTITKEDCPCFGPLQSIFVQLLCGQTQKSRMELATITLNQLDNSRFLKFLLRLPYLMYQKFMNPLKDPKQQQKKRKATSNNNPAFDLLSLLEEDIEKSGGIDSYSLNGIYHPGVLPAKQREALYVQYIGLVDILQKYRKRKSFASPKYHPVISRPIVSSPRRSTTPRPLKLIKQKSNLKSQRNLLKSSANNSGGGASNKMGKNGPEKGKETSSSSSTQSILLRSALLTVLRNGDIPLPQVRHFITTTEFDILYAKSKLDTNSTNKISYEEFCRCLDYVGEVHYHQSTDDVSPNANISSVPASMPSSHDNTATNTAANSVANEGDEETNTIVSATETVGNQDLLLDGEEVKDKQEGVAETKEGIAERTVAIEGPGPTMRLDRFLARHSDHVNRKTAFINYENLFLHDLESHFLGSDSQSIHYRLVFSLRILYFFQEETVVQSILSWLEREAYGRLILFIVKIQSVMRYKLAQGIVQRRKLAKRQEDLQRIQVSKIILMQAVIRRFLVRCQIRRKVKDVIIKYIPYLQTPYYYHPKTGVKSHTKPKILTRGNPSDLDDCYSIAVPEKGLENIIYCYQCRYRQAIIFCQQCEDSMCMICYQSLHFKGSKSHHTYQKIPKCSYCQYQVATKSCVTCVTHPPLTGSIQASKTTFARGLYCDTCFLHEHDAYTKQIETSTEKRQQIRKLLYGSARPNANLISKFLCQKIMTSHYYEALTMNCEECNQLSASWRCYHCQQIYCHRCLIYLHSINPIFVHHQVEALSYYTAKMHKSLQKDLNQMYFVMKWEKCLIKERQRQARIEYMSAIRIQAWWRRYFYAKIGKKYMKRQRLRQRKWWRLRQKENQEIRSLWSYQAQNLIGFAPVLSSDTMEEKVLKTLPAWSRQTAREFIWKNQADWGYYRIDSKRPRKGIPKKGFQVGELEELQEQAKLLGYRLPGRIIVRTAEHIFDTTCDLSEIVRPGEIIRMKKYLFGVVSVDPTSIRLNRLWRETKNRFKSDEEEGEDVEDGEEEEDEDSEYDEEGRLRGVIAYRMPTYTNEKYQYYYRLRFFLYDITLGNPLVQGSLYLYKQYSLRMMNFSLYMMRMNKRSKLYDESYQWKVTAVKYADQARKISAYFTTKEALIDLTKVTLTEELKKRRFGDKKSSKKQRRTDEEDEDDDDDEEEDDEGGGAGRRLTGGDGEEDPLLSAKSMKYGRASRRRRFSLRSSFGGAGKYTPKPASILPDENDDDLFGGEEGELDEKDGLGKDKSAADIKKAKKEKIKKARKQSVLSMMENLSMKSNRYGITKSVKLEEEKDKEPEEGETREGFFASSKKRFFEPEVENVGIAKKNLKNPKAKTALLEKKPDKPWFATKEQELARREREEKMSPATLALEADDWKEMIDPMTENVYYLNIYTNEMMTTVPRALTAKKQLEFENSKNKKSYDDARRRIDHLEKVTKNRLLITGYRKK